MAGHSHWAGIKRKKEVADKKRGALFSKLLVAVTIAARNEPNPGFNPRLRTAVEKAKEASVPKDRIDAAIAHASQKEEALEEFLFEGYGPGGSAILVEAISESRNRIVSEIKKIFSDHKAKFAEAGGVRWAFKKTEDGWKATFKQDLSPDDRKKLSDLVESLEAHDEVQNVVTNAG